MAINNRKSQNDSTFVDSNNIFARESYKKARTNIDHLIDKKGCKIITITSPFSNEGKTLTATNIAIAFAQQFDTKVLIIDCDLRLPSLHTKLNITTAPGVTNYLNEECKIEDIIKSTAVSNLKAICYGDIPENPSELLSSNRMSELIKALESDFDYIIFDTPPVNFFVDALSMIKKSDGVVLVAKERSTTYPQLDKAIDEINKVNGKILGVIVNKVKVKETERNYYYKYR